MQLRPAQKRLFRQYLEVCACSYWHIRVETPIALHTVSRIECRINFPQNQRCRAKVARHPPPPKSRCREAHSMDQCRSRLKPSMNFERHWSILISGEIHMDQSLVHTFSWGNSYGPMVLKVFLKFPPTLALVHGWLFAEVSHLSPEPPPVALSSHSQQTGGQGGCRGGLVASRHFCGQPTSVTYNVKNLCIFEPQIWLEIFTSRDAQSTCFKGSQTSCTEILSGVFWPKFGRKKSHHVMDAAR